jgi:hypothetical protein
MSKSKPLRHPLAEVFGFKTTDRSSKARKHRDEEICPFNNGVDKCTKDKKDAPLGVCSIFYDESPVIICPIRFREEWKISRDAADFFFEAGQAFTALKEVRLKEKTGKSAGNVDLIIVRHDTNGKVLDFGAVEVQAVYVSGNIRNPFEYFMQDPEKRAEMDWTQEQHFPRPDFLSSSRKRLAPQIMYKGQILRAWGKKLAVVVDGPFFKTLPQMVTVSKEKAEVCWLVYDLIEVGARFEMTLSQTVYTTWNEVFKSITNPEIGDVDDFISVLEQKLSPVVLDEMFRPNLVHDWTSL